MSYKKPSKIPSGLTWTLSWPPALFLMKIRKQSSTIPVSKPYSRKLTTSATNSSSFPHQNSLRLILVNQDIVMIVKLQWRHFRFWNSRQPFYLLSSATTSKRKILRGWLTAPRSTSGSSETPCTSIARKLRSESSLILALLTFSYSLQLVKKVKFTSKISLQKLDKITHLNKKRK